MNEKRYSKVKDGVSSSAMGNYELTVFCHVTWMPFSNMKYHLFEMDIRGKYYVSVTCHYSDDNRQMIQETYASQYLEIPEDDIPVYLEVTCPLIHAHNVGYLQLPKVTSSIKTSDMK